MMERNLSIKQSEVLYVKFPVTGRNKAVLVFTDAYGSNDYEEYIQYPVGQVIFFSTDEMSEEDFLLLCKAGWGIRRRSLPNVY